MTASEKILQKALAASNLDSKRWNKIQAELRDRAFFSSQVESARILHTARELSAQVASGDLSLSDFRLQLRHALDLDHYNPEDKRGTIKDLLTARRLDLIVKTNVAQARGYVQHLQATNEGALLAYPCYELVRVAQRKQPRNWAARWRDAGGRFFGGRMIATKTDPIWTRISAFGNPFPPFDWGSGMGLDEVGYAEAVKLGVIERGQKIEPPKIDFNGNLEATVPMRHDSPEADTLREAFGIEEDEKGALVSFEENVVHWHGERIQEVVKGTLKKVNLGRGYDGRNLSLSHNIIADHIKKHIGENDRDSRNVPLEPGDFKLIPAIWRKPDEVIKSKNCDHLKLEAFDGTLNLIVDPNRGIVSFYKQKNPGGA